MKRSPKPWTPEQDSLLREKWAGNRPIHEFIDVLGHSKFGIYGRAVTLGLGPRRKRVVSDWAWQDIQMALKQEPQTIRSLMKKTGRSERRIREILTDEHKSDVRVARYEHGRTAAPAPVYALGPGRVARPPKMRASEKREFDRLQRAAGHDPEVQARVAARRRIFDAEFDGSLICRDEFTAAFFGEAA